MVPANVGDRGLASVKGRIGIRANERNVGKHVAEDTDTTCAAAVSIAGMDGNNGAWGMLAGNPAFTTTSIGMYAFECQMADSERNHTDTQMSYIVFE